MSGNPSRLLWLLSLMLVLFSVGYGVPSDKISTSLALDSFHKIRVSWVKNQVSAQSDAQICFLS